MVSGKFNRLICLVISLKLVLSQIENTATPTDAGNLRHPLAPRPILPAVRTPSVAELALLNRTNATTTIFPTNATVITTTTTTNVTNATIVPTNATIVPIVPTNFTNATVIPSNATVVPPNATVPMNITGLVASAPPINITSTNVTTTNLTTTTITTNVTTPNTTAATPTPTAIAPGPNLTATTPVVTPTVVSAPVIAIPAVVPLATANLTAANNLTLHQLIPTPFFVDKNGSLSNTSDYIILKTPNKELLDCNVLGNLTIRTGEVVPDNLFIPVLFNDTAVSLRSFYGGYVEYINQKFDCASRTRTNSSNLLVEHINQANLAGVPPGVNLTNAIAFRTPDGYLGVLNGNVSLVQNLNLSDVFIPNSST